MPPQIIIQKINYHLIEENNSLAFWERTIYTLFEPYILNQFIQISSSPQLKLFIEFRKGKIEQKQKKWNRIDALNPLML